MGLSRVQKTSKSKGGLYRGWRTLTFKDGKNRLSAWLEPIAKRVKAGPKPEKAADEGEQGAVGTNLVWRKTGPGAGRQRLKMKLVWCPAERF